MTQALKDISLFSVESIGDNLAKIDIGRDIRKLTPEVILSEGKDPKDVIRIALSMLEKKDVVLISRIRKITSLNFILHSKENGSRLKWGEGVQLCLSQGVFRF